ncbi:MAG TPA: TPM domain-containing protein [Candidatus Eisenbacteria bacterium]
MIPVRFLAALLLLAAVLALRPVSAAAEFVLPPPPGRHIVDKAGILDPGSISYLEERLTRFEQETGHQMVIAIFKGIEGDDLEEVSNKLFRKWGLGDKTANDGILLAIFYQERISRVEVGYGLEGVLTDARCARILRNEFQPEFQTGRYGQGLRRAVVAIEQLVRDPSSAPPDTTAREKKKSSSSFWIAILAFFIIFAFSMASARSRRGGSELTGSGRRRYRDPWDDGWGGGGFGGFGGFGGGGGGWGGGFSGGGGGFSGGGGSSGGGGASGKW